MGVIAVINTSVSAFVFSCFGLFSLEFLSKGLSGFNLFLHEPRGGERERQREREREREEDAQRDVREAHRTRHSERERMRLGETGETTGVGRCR